MNVTTVHSTSSVSLLSYWLEAKHQFLQLLRTPAFSLPALLFPLVFYLMFGVMFGGGAQRQVLGNYIVFGIMGAALFGFGVTVAMDRTLGILALKRAQPTPPGAYLLAKMAMAMVFALVIVLTLLLAATLLADVQLSGGEMLLLLVTGVFGTLPFSTLGLFLGTLVGGNAAPAVVNLVYLPMAFLSGLWIPLSVLPGIIDRIAPVWPSWHLSQVAHAALGVVPAEPLWLHLGVLSVAAACFFVLANARLQRCG